MTRRACPGIVTRSLAILAMALLALPVRGQSLIRDAEMEYALERVAAPILYASGYGAGMIEIIVLNDPSLNAFVIDGRHVFIHSGLLTRLDDPAELQAIIGHELAHVANGHIIRRTGNLTSARSAAGLGLALGIALAAAGGGEAAAGIALGTQGAAMRSFLSHTRAEEIAADRTAIRTLAAAGIDPAAMLRVMELFRGQEALSPARQDPYLRTHPLWRDRLRAIEAQVAAYRGPDQTDAETAYWYARAVAKLRGFLNNPSWVLRRTGDDRGEAATLARAIAYHRQPDIARALAETDRLIAMRPDDPFYHELRGQILLESGRASAAVGAYAEAVRLGPNEPLIRAGLGRAQLATGDIAAARATLETARARDPRDSRTLRDLALAYARSGQNGMASLVTAERYALSGRWRDATVNAERAMALLPVGSTGWRRAEDIVVAARAAQ
jgi:predicted Zn-dependent protease